MGITALVGGQFGSEGKGLIAGHIAKDYQLHVRVGAANAGHTFYTGDEKHVVQQLPCAAYAAPDSIVALGPGALLNLHILGREIDECQRWREERNLTDLVVLIDPRAHVITEQQMEEEQATDLAERIGSTSTIAREGIGTAQAAKVLRRDDCFVVGNNMKAVTDLESGDAEVEVCDIPEAIWESRDRGVLLEGTQGTGLSLTHGFFPYTTSRDTTASGLASDCGVGPRNVDQVIMVCRTYPIRVAGNSGPFYADSEETNFQEIGQNEERTTVTKKVRRVATFSMRQVEDAARLNSATSIALTFTDYLDPSLYGKSGAGVPILGTSPVFTLIRDISTRTGVPVDYLGTGPKSLLTAPGL